MSAGKNTANIWINKREKLRQEKDREKCGINGSIPLLGTIGNIAERNIKITVK